MDQGVEDIWPEVIQEANAISPYYLLLGRVPGREGEVKVKVKFFDNCFAEYDNKSLARTINSEFTTGDRDIVKKLRFGIKEFAFRAEKKLNCCVEQKSKSSNTIDTSFLSLALFIDNSCCPIYAYDRPVALVNDFPAMPQIEYELEYYKQLNSCVDLNAEIVVYFGRKTKVTERNRKDTLRFNYHLLDLNTKYAIDFQDQFQGGRVDFILSDGNNDTLEVFHWTIKGDNPSAGSVYNYIDEKNYADTFWFIKQIATHENGAHPNTLADPLRHFNPHNTSIESLRDDWNQSSRCPNLSDNKDGGWGLTQFTNPVPTSKALWNWKQNIDDAYTLIWYDTTIPNTSEPGKSYYVRNKLNNDLKVVNKWNDDPNNENDKVEMVDTTYAGIRWRYSITPRFGGYSSIESYFDQSEANDQERSFIDACLMVAYNGYGGNLINGRHVNFLYATRPAQGEKPGWRLLDNQNNYVSRICTEFIPQ